MPRIAISAVSLLLLCAACDSSSAFERTEYRKFRASPSDYAKAFRSLNVKEKWAAYHYIRNHFMEYTPDDLQEAMAADGRPMFAEILSHRAEPQGSVYDEDILTIASKMKESGAYDVCADSAALTVLKARQEDIEVTTFAEKYKHTLAGLCS